MTFAHEARQFGKILTTPGGQALGVICGFESDCEGRFAFINCVDLSGYFGMVPVKWVCPICKAERETGANFCKLCGAYLTVKLEGSG